MTTKKQVITQKWLKQKIAETHRDLSDRFEEFGNCPSVYKCEGALTAYNIVLTKIKKKIKRVNSSVKGKSGEREFVHWLKDNLGIGARRGQQFKGTPDSPDVISDLEGIHWEVKRVQALILSEAMSKAVEDSGSDQVPVVAHRKNNQEWLLTFQAKDLKEFCKHVQTATLSD